VSREATTGQRWSGRHHFAHEVSGGGFGFKVEFSQSTLEETPGSLGGVGSPQF
jgi:hypothetical protein